MPDPPRVGLRLLDPPHRILTGRQLEPHGELHNHDDGDWTATVATRFSGLLLRQPSEDTSAGGAGWQTMAGRQLLLPAHGRVEIPGYVEARGPTPAPAPRCSPAGATG